MFWVNGARGRNRTTDTRIFNPNLEFHREKEAYGDLLKQREYPKNFSIKNSRLIQSQGKIAAPTYPQDSFLWITYST